MTIAMAVFSHEVPATAKAAPLGRSWLLDVLDGWGIPGDQDIAAALELAAAEVIANAYKAESRADKPSPQLEITACRFSTRPLGIRVGVGDHNVAHPRYHGFPEIVSPADKVKFQTAAEGGWGLPLVEAYEFEFGGRQMHFIWYILPRDDGGKWLIIEGPYPVDTAENA